MPRIFSFQGGSSGGGGSAGNAFGIVHGTSGTNPEALAPHATLNFTSTDGTLRAIGDSVSNSVDFSVVFAIPTGSVGSPGLYFQGDTDTGIFQTSANNLSITSGGVEVARFDSSGNLEVTGGKLQFNGSTSGSITFKAPASGGSGDYILPSAYPPINEVLQSDPSGNLSWVPNGGQIESFPCNSNVAVKDVVRIDSSAVAQRAQADTASNAEAFGIVESKPTTTTCVIRVNGISSTIYSALAPTSTYFLSDVTAGGLVTSPPTSAGSTIIRIGKALNSTQLNIRISLPLRRA